MHFIKTLGIVLCTSLLSAVAMAQTDDGEDSTAAEKPHHHMRHHSGSEMSISGTDDMKPTPVGHWYVGNEFDGAIFSTAISERPGHRRDLTPVRFSALNFGYHFNYDFDAHFGMFTGIGIKNIGFIEKDGDSTTKRRVYTIGVPLGFKLGNLQSHHYGFIGGGVDFPFNYREKRFVSRNDKSKFNEFWSDRTEHYMPYIFAGFAYKGGNTIKVQYYPSNFFNTGYEESPHDVVTRPYSGYRTNLLYITIGFDIHYKRHPHMKKEEEDTTAAPAEM